MQCMDKSVEDGGSLPQARVREPAQVQYERNPNPNWPFLFHIEDGRWYVNRSKRRSQYQQAQDVGEAML